jgi:excinuclease ABC subunit C
MAPQRGARAKLVTLADKNAQASYASRRDKAADIEEGLNKLQGRLQLKRSPKRIECFDISHLAGSATVASMVVFLDGEPAKGEYRHFKVKTATNDDFASMYEVLSRRFRRAKQPDEGDAWKLPDLIVVDGGKGQLAMALAAARDVGIDVRPGSGLPIVALAKEREAELAELTEAVAAPPPEAPAVEAPPVEAPPAETPPDVAAAVPEEGATEVKAGKKDGGKKRGEKDAKKPDRIFLPHAKDAIPIRPSSAEMFVLQALRDEAHRFAVSFHRGQRRRLTLRSALSDIPGIGPGRQRQLLRHFGSIKRVREASVDDLAAVSGISRSVAEAVHAHWAKQPLDAGVVEPQPTAEAAAAEQPHAEEQAIDAAFTDDQARGSGPER